MERYARRLPARLDELAERIARLADDPQDPTRRSAALTTAHQLRGTAGSFGFPRVSEEIGKIDDALRHAGKRAPIDMAALSAWLEAARELVRSAPGLAQPEVASWKARLLYLGDDADSSARVQELGRRRLIEILPATTLAEAAQHLAREETDGALVELPAAQGDEADELASRLQAIPGCAGLPLAFVSADEETPSRVRAANAGAALFLPKPITETGLDDAANQLAAIRRATRPRVLILDDDPAFASLAAHALGSGGALARTLSRPDELLGLLESADPEALVLDVRMPGGIGGLDICRMLRTTSRWQDLPILMVTGDARPETRLASYAAGCDDVLVKPVRADELRLRVKLRVERRRLQHARLERDPLTDLPLRRFFVERLRARLSEAHRRRLPLSLVLLDLDHFKQLNDRHGHLAGDRALAHLGHLLAARFRSEDLRARWGGEEFIVAFPGERAEIAAALAQGVLDDLKRSSIEADDGARFSVSFSAGVAEFPRDGASMEALLRSVDQRLYAAKAAGRGRVAHREHP